jgi:cell filamentation protein
MKNIDKISLENAYRLFDTGEINKVEIGTTICLTDCMILLDKSAQKT